MLRSFRSTTLFLLMLGLLAACQSRQPATTVPTTPTTASQLTGKQLATAYCGNCHLLPDPSLLPKSIWKNKVLPQMALRLGFSIDSISPFVTVADPDEINRILQSGVFAGSQLLHTDDWNKLVQYYVDRAPVNPLPAPAKPAVEVGLPLFTLRTSPQRIHASTTLLRYDQAAKRILVGTEKGKVYMLDNALRVIDSTLVGSAPTDIRPTADGSYYLLTSGDMEPNDLLKGKWQPISFRGHPGTLTTPSTMPVVDQLGRPVAAAVGDLTQDGQEDIVICQFGNYSGELTWFERRGSSYFPHMLDPVPGARRAIIHDVNQDGRPDIVALLSQGNEQIAVYYNDGGGKFTKDILLQFPSVYGSSYFDLVDMDKDGDLDILYTNGDNGDKSYSLKAYHGVRVFLNDGRFTFKQSLFYPLYGATQAIARDFDQDGDVDIAAISFFPNYDTKPVEAFVFLENQGAMHMKAKTFPHPEQGHWLVMEAADVDQDGDDDLLLGSFSRAITPTPQTLSKKWFTDGKGIVLLENQLRHTKQ
ncbi:FG-GAP repeat domain-containing protein [Fibrella forsythiae]|uniref:VCBS repeat-containing protein n=1 Tax=Fibrella forsythiae TaxID=2817061 RepID=A0ABS3JCK7_9BACT|nr:VCBS repeat-containing protein [Fibrella forsythiae]MBO0947173.1 VCBS repeat-containing protein [Fibrella forsythiae]